MQRRFVCGAFQQRQTTSKPNVLETHHNNYHKVDHEFRAFLLTRHELSANERTCIVDQALILLEQNYVHLPMKRAMYSVDPIGRLKALRLRVGSARRTNGHRSGWLRRCLKVA